MSSLLPLPMPTAPGGGGGAPPPQSSLDTLKILEMLDCPVCLEVPLPPIQMCLQGHSICSNCRKKLAKCPLCLDDFSSARNLLVEQLVQQLLKKCVFAKEGCGCTLPIGEMEGHKETCDFRMVICDQLQSKTCYSVKMNYTKYFTHLVNVHKVKGILGTIINVSQFITSDQSGLTTNMPRGMWPLQYMDACNEKFLTGTEIREGKIFWWLYVIGNDTTAEKYMTKITLTLKKNGYETSWTGPVHSFRKKPEEILRQGFCLLATPDTLRPFLSTRRANTGQEEGQSQEEQPNVGWNLTFSVMKKEKVLHQDKSHSHHSHHATPPQKQQTPGQASSLNLNPHLSTSSPMSLSTNNIALQNLPISPSKYSFLQFASCTSLPIPSGESCFNDGASSGTSGSIRSGSGASSGSSSSVTSSSTLSSVDSPRTQPPAPPTHSGEGSKKKRAKKKKKEKEGEIGSQEQEETSSHTLIAQQSGTS